MGKLGGRELNFSSDIDLIYIYSSDSGETQGVDGNSRKRISLHAFFVKLAERLTRMINAPTEDGYVFRVDLDLRPEGGGGAIASSLSSAEIYYESWGQTWERSAMIKARVVAGSRELGESFAAMIEPFVYRRFLDFTAIEELKGMKEKLDLALLRRAPDRVDVKLGEGGIREIEFFCQALQLIHGGKEPAIREKGTLKAIEALCARGLFDPVYGEEFSRCYAFLRNVEHRIQIVEGRQTHAIPVDTVQTTRLARSMGHRDTGDGSALESFWREYRERTGKVYEIYRSLFYSASEELGDGISREVLLLFSPDIDLEESAACLADMGFKESLDAARRITTLRGGRTHGEMPPRAREMLSRLGPFLVARAIESPSPERALANLESFITSVRMKETFYALLSENVKLTELLVKIFGTSEFLSRTLMEQPAAIDLLLGEELSRPHKSRPESRNEIGGRLAECRGDIEESLDRLRRFKRREVFRIGINHILGRLGFEGVSEEMSSVAEVCLDAAFAVATDDLAPRFGRPQKARFAVIGLGKLGSKELIYGSDLDVVFVYDEPEPDHIDPGLEKISDREYYVKLGQRIISNLTLMTREGVVFPVDMRLRPSGSSGPLVLPLQSFLGYHREKAEVWESQALLKARPVAADLEFGKEVVETIGEIVYHRGLTSADAKELLRIRKRMEDEIAKEAPGRYNIKTGRGAFVDIEFLVQMLALRHGAEHAGLRTPSTTEGLAALKEASLISEQEYEILLGAYLLYKRIEINLRIVDDRPGGELVAGTAELTALAKRIGYKGDDPGTALMEEYSGFAEKVRAIYLAHLEVL